MTALPELCGQGEPWTRLIAQARGHRLHHGVLLCGPRGVGKSAAARCLAAALTCEDDSAPVPCGSCRACRKVAAGRHPDVHRLEPPEDKRDIPVESVRAIQEVLARTAVEGRARVVLFDPADRLNEQGQNALLKTLEEPGPATWLVLATARPEALLETVRSRVTRLPLQTLPEAEVLGLLEARNLGTPESRARAAALARGSVGTAVELLGDEAERIHDLVVPFLAGTDSLGPWALAKALLEGASGRAEARARAVRALTWLRVLHRGAARLLVGSDGPTYAPSTLDPWTAQCELLFAAEEDLELQVPPEQALAGVFLRWWEVAR